MQRVWRGEPDGYCRLFQVIQMQGPWPELSTNMEQHLASLAGCQQPIPGYAVAVVHKRQCCFSGRRILPRSCRQ